MNTREEAHTALDAALSIQRDSRKRLDDMQSNIREAKADVMAADAQVLLARAALARFAPVAGEKDKSGAHSAIRAAVTRILAGSSEPLTVDQIIASLASEGLTLAGKDPRSNLMAYLSRWDGITGTGRGKYTVPATTDVPAFLAPHTPEEANLSDVGTDVPAETPAFLAPVAPVEEAPRDDLQALPDGFPGSQALADAGFTTRESLEGKTHDQLRRIKGIGAETARLILAALEA